MIRTMIFSGLGCWIGLTLLVSQTAWGRRLPLAERLRPHAPGRPGRRAGSGLFSTESAVDVLGPLASAIGSKLAQVVGINEDLTVRLTRVHETIDAPAFRLRQLGLATVALVGALMVGLLASLPLAFIALMLVVAPALTFLLIEQGLAKQSKQWQRRLFLEAPIVAEQLAMLLSAGNSLGGALQYTSRRGEGAIARDLTGVVQRVRQGLTEPQALQEWAEVAKVPSIDRLVAVLALAGTGADLGRIVADEARSLRREVHRELISTIEKRNQQVWIPVTVAALVPGIVLLAIPFLSAMEGFAS
jgi:tight adherence protein C